jgi:hypothetical protein
MTHALLGHTETAIEHLGRARQLNPLDASGHAHWVGMTLAHFFGGNYDEAKVAVDKALAQWPASPAALRHKAAICGLFGHVDEGRRCVQQYLAVSPASSLTAVREQLELQMRGNSDGRDKYIEGLRLSGLPDADPSGGV